MTEIREQAVKAAEELCDAAGLKKGQILVVGCSSSEIIGKKIGSCSSEETAQEVYDALQSVLRPRGIYLAAQCCEHLNRAIIIEAEAVPGAEICNVVPQPKAGGSFATAAYNDMKNPVALEEIKADAGLDIGNTLIGMHLKRVAVPVRLKEKYIGEAPLVAARTRPKFIGGCRAVYNDALGVDNRR
ncbi:MAG: TIGR01440 family protein [Lachnospiraceae bacterium]|nr:TIGR01440 family protein [Lachnospiraceae bacterium]